MWRGYGNEPAIQREFSEAPVRMRPPAIMPITRAQPTLVTGRSWKNDRSRGFADADWEQIIFGCFSLMRVLRMPTLAHIAPSCRGVRHRVRAHVCVS